ncbi:unannotated protein [freshwater metagenome]|uniref:Unannotated protein n=1 Tax=freshwater metagenome TaxID=449393 RepID=A0A6J7Q1T3_9ZZZZ
MVPKRAVGEFASGTFFISQFILLPEKYGAIVRPVLKRTVSFS